MKVIILSAGQGRRLLPLTEDTPKCALPVNGLSMLEWQLHEISQCAVDEVVVVTGFRADRVDKIVQKTRVPAIRTLFNPFYASSDNLRTCVAAGGEMDGPFVIINGDTLFEAAILKRLLATEPDAPITLVTDCKATYDNDDMKVVVDGTRLRRVGKQLSAGVNGESIGMMIFRGDGPRLFKVKAEDMINREDGSRRWYLSAIDELAEETKVNVLSIAGFSWCEVDNAEDLIHAESVVASWYRDETQQPLRATQGG